jgi:hypothetical protein
MKKFASLVAAGALLLSTAGAVFAYPIYFGSSVSQFGFTQSQTGATSVSGQNSQMGSGNQAMFTGSSTSTAKSLTAGNVNVGGSQVNQMATTGSVTGAKSISGQNGQVGFGGFFSPSNQFTGTGASGSYAGSVTVSNVNFSFGH